MRPQRSPSRPTRVLAAGVFLALLYAPTAEAGTSFAVNRIHTVAATGTPAENCQSLRDVLASISDNSFSNKYLVQLEPGTFACGSNSIFLGEGIAVVGAGIGHTVIEGQVENNVFGLIHINAGGVQLRSLTVINSHLAGGPTSQDMIGVSIFSFLSDSPMIAIKLRDVFVFGLHYSLSSSNAEFDVWGSQLENTVRHDGSGDASKPASISFSAVDTVEGTAPTGCYLCYDIFTGAALDNGCNQAP